MSSCPGKGTDDLTPEDVAYREHFDAVRRAERAARAQFESFPAFFGMRAFFDDLAPVPAIRTLPGARQRGAPDLFITPVEGSRRTAWRGD